MKRIDNTALHRAKPPLLVRERAQAASIVQVDVARRTGRRRCWRLTSLLLERTVPDRRRTPLRFVQIDTLPAGRALVDVDKLTTRYPKTAAPGCSSAPNTWTAVYRPRKICKCEL